MKIGIYFTAVSSQGGVHQYSVSILEAFNRIRGHTYTIFNEGGEVPEKFRKDERFKVVDVYPKEKSLSTEIYRLFNIGMGVIEPYVIKPLYHFGGLSFIDVFCRLRNFRLVNIVRSVKLDLIFYPTATSVSFLSGVPFVVTVYDLEHRIKPRFKEVSANGRWEEREYIYTNIAKKSFGMFVDSQVGKEDLLNSYETTEKQIIILPYIPADYLNPNISSEKIIKIKKKLRLPDKYIFYPAKFWSHKNHLNLIEAIRILKLKGKMVNLVLTGNTKAEFTTYPKITNLIDEYGLGDQVKHMGYLDYDELSSVYKLSQAMVMPSFFGPTNLPILEAWVMGTPAITSNIRGCRDQLGKAGLLINPWDPRDIALKIERIYGNEKLRKKLIELGKIKSKLWTQADFSNRVNSILYKFSQNR